MKSYWIDILFNPRRTMKKIIQEDIHYGKSFLPFYSGLAISGTLLNPDAPAAITFNPITLLFLTLLFAWPLGWAGYRICARVGQYLAHKMNKEVSRETFEALILWTGYISFFPIFLKIILTLSSNSPGFSVIQMFADIALHYLILGLTLYTLIISIILTKDILEFDWIKTVVFVLLYSIIVLAMLFVLIFISTLFISMGLLLQTLFLQ